MKEGRLPRVRIAAACPRFAAFLAFALLVSEPSAAELGLRFAAGPAAHESEGFPASLSASASIGARAAFPLSGKLRGTIGLGLGAVGESLVSGGVIYAGERSVEVSLGLGMVDLRLGFLDRCYADLAFGASLAAPWDEDWIFAQAHVESRAGLRIPLESWKSALELGAMYRYEYAPRYSRHVLGLDLCIMRSLR